MFANKFLNNSILPFPATFEIPHKYTKWNSCVPNV